MQDKLLIRNSSFMIGEHLPQRSTAQPNHETMVSDRRCASPFYDE